LPEESGSTAILLLFFPYISQTLSVNNIYLVAEYLGGYVILVDTKVYNGIK
jgi:hypothetical protein